MIAALAAHAPSVASMKRCPSMWDVSGPGTSSASASRMAPAN